MQPFGSRNSSYSGASCTSIAAKVGSNRMCTLTPVGFIDAFRKAPPMSVTTTSLLSNSSNFLVFAVAAMAAAEGRLVVVTDIGGAFLNASMKPTGVKEHMRLEPTLAAMLVQLAPEYELFLEPNGCMVVELDKVLYSCVEAALPWFNDLRGKLEAFGFVANPYDRCVFNKYDESTGMQMTLVLHVDDLMVTCVDRCQLD
jgi:hypothetical protein